jgi:hypothetical protein
MPEPKHSEHSVRLRIELSSSEPTGPRTEAKTRFWSALPPQQREAFGPQENLDIYEAHFKSELTSRLNTFARRADSGIWFGEVEILGYGSMLVKVPWWGPDATDLVFAWVGACLRDLLGPSAVIVSSETEAKQRSIAGLVLERVLPMIPQRPASLVFGLTLLSGVCLLWLSWNLYESLFDRRTALIEKLLAQSSENEGAWQATFAAMSASPKSTDAGGAPSISNNVTYQCPVPTPSTPKPTGPSCCQLLAEAIRSAGILPGALPVSAAAGSSP